MWLFSLALLAFSIPDFACLDSENNELMYKFTIVTGSPDSLNGSSTASVGDFDECVEKCREDVECVLAHQETSSAPCYLFPWGSVTGVRGNASGEGGDGQVAFKVYTNQPACELNAVYLLNGKIYPIYPNDTEKYQWRVDTSEFGWTLTYLPCASDEQQEVCGNWGALRPYPDSCNNECKLTMLQVYAQPGKITRPISNSTEEETWMDCMIACYSDYTCAVVHYIEAEKKCNRYLHGMLNILSKTAPEEGQRMAIKAPTSNVTCNWSTEKLLEDTYYIPYHRIAFYVYQREYFRIQNLEKYYLIMYYADAALDRLYQYNCPANFQAVGIETNGTSKTCHQPFRAENMTQPEAKQFCEAMGGHLFVQPGTYPDSSIQFMVSGSGRRWEMGDFPFKRFWFGLEKRADCATSKNSTLCTALGGWEWSEPEWMYESVALKPIPWGDGEPSSEPNKTCAYMQLLGVRAGTDNGPNARPRNYTFMSAECDRGDLEGFSCGNYNMKKLGVRTYEDVNREYGINETCCGYTSQYWFRAQDWPTEFVLMNGTKDEL